MRPTDTQDEDLRVIGTETGSWLWQRPCGRVVPFRFMSRESALATLPGTIEIEFEAHEVL